MTESHAEVTAPEFDLLVLTASDERQASIYRRVVSRLLEDGSVPARDLLVVPDPGGRRVGSGGATLEAACGAATRLVRDATGADLASVFAGRRVLVVHSGGESRRLPAFAAIGKILTPLDPHGARGGPKTILEAIVRGLVAVPCDPAGQFMIATGDALVDPEGVDFAGAGVIGLAQLDSVERGSRHGVFVADPDGRVRDMLQKPDPAEAKAAGAVRGGRRLLVDTGVLSLAPAAIARWMKAAGLTRRDRTIVVGDGLLASVRRGDVGPVELYHEVLKAIPEEVDASAFDEVVGGTARSERRRGLRTWRRRVKGMPFSVRIARGRPFLHPGTTREFLDIVASHDEPVIVSSTGGTGAHGGVVVDASMLEGVHCSLPGRNLVVGVPTTTRLDLHLQPGECLFLLPVRSEEGGSKWLAVAHDEHDDFKTPVEAGGTLGGRPVTEHPVASWVAAGFETPDISLRELPLWIPDSPERTIRHALATLRGRARGVPTRWSLATALERVDVDRLLEHRDRAVEANLERHAVAAITADAATPIDAVAAEIPPRLAGVIADRLATVSDDAAPGESARLLAAASRLDLRAGRDDLPRIRRALERVGDEVSEPVPPTTGRQAAIVLPDQAVWCASPVRIDLAGGWSDTPPICVDLGGAVVNAAVLLHGKQPLQAVAKLLDEPKVVIHSVDLGASRTFHAADELLAPADPADWTTLPRMALEIAGVTPTDPGVSLADRLDALGGGLVLTLYSAVPKGSGLGTSSILGATVLACLDRLFEPGLDPASVIERTSVLEQAMTTRGGWQDQVGGVHGGLKIGRTRPGPIQRPRVEPLHPPAGFVEELEARSVLLYSGEKRLARNILEKVVGRYLARDPAAIRIVHEIKDNAAGMTEALRDGDFDRFAGELARCWALKRAFDPAASNPRIEGLADAHARDLAAWTLPGAGGGGFLMLLARDRKAAERIRRRVGRKPPNALARTFPLEFDPDGLRITVL